MAENRETANVSLGVPISEENVRQAASDFPVTFDQVSDALVEIQGVLSEEINEFYHEAWIGGGAENHLFDMDHGVFFAFVPSRLYRRYFETSDMDWELFHTASIAHEYEARRFEFTVDRPTNFANNLKGDSDFAPFFIRYPGGWRRAKQNAMLQLEFLLHHGMTLGEALDYWALEFSNVDSSGWHAARDVDREATYKTVRQAKEKLGDESRKPYHEKQDIRTVKVDRED